MYIFVILSHMCYRCLYVFGTDFRIFFHILSICPDSLRPTVTQRSLSFHPMYERTLAYPVIIFCIISYAITEAASESSVCDTGRGRCIFDSHLCQWQAGWSIMGHVGPFGSSVKWRRSAHSPFNMCRAQTASPENLTARQALEPA